MSKSKIYNLSDQTIGQIVQLVQLGILTGTDISDQMRTLRVVVNNELETIDPCPDYMKIFSENLEKMQEANGSDEQN